VIGKYYAAAPHIRDSHEKNTMNYKEPKKKARVLIVEDHPPASGALATLIGRQGDLEVCGEAADMNEALQSIADTLPDVAIIDVSLKNGNGIDLIRQVKERNDRVRILVLSMDEDWLYAERVLQAGALGYISKDGATGKIIEAIRRVLGGRIWLSKEMAERILQRIIAADLQAASRSPLGILSDGELEVFFQIGQGMQTAYIAERLHASIKSVEIYRDRIRRQLGMRNGTELAHYATRWVIENH
jgi:DNA-binding NarL/FixJ family response regulator